ncbi:hypothetical protein OROMI_013690 [Orobanche minor]
MKSINEENIKTRQPRNIRKIKINRNKISRILQVRDHGTKTPRGKPFFGRDPTKVERVLRDSPGCPPMVVDFLAGSAPRGQVDVPSCVNRAIASLPRAWTMDLNEVTNRRGNDATQALFALALQTTTMAAIVARESELRPSVPKLRADLEESRKLNGELCDRVAKMEKDSNEAAKRASLQVEHLTNANDLLKEQMLEVRRNYDAVMKEDAAELSVHKDQMNKALEEIKRLSERACRTEFKITVEYTVGYSLDKDVC